MPTSLELTDAYVAELLKRDAERGVSLKRPRSDAPKPNTRFLRNIVRDVDSHNTALKAKEEQESRARLRKLRREDRLLHGKEAGEARQGGSSRDLDREDKHRRTGERSDRGDEKRSTRDERHRHRRRRDREDDREKDTRRRHHSRSRTRSRSPRRKSASHHRSSKPVSDRSNPPDRTNRLSPTERRSPLHSHTSDQDSDSDVLGPKPPPKNPPRGRGAYKNAEISSRFDPSYDPREDVALGDEEALGDDWDMALEAMRDRTRWRASGAERLKAAGFTEQEVLGWQGRGVKSRDGDQERDVKDLVWKKRGEKRAWDEDKQF